LPKTAVVILNWNGKKFLEQFLPVIITYSQDHAEIIIADNASTDNSVNFLQENFPAIQVIRNATNGGFSKGYNDAFQSIKADYFILLNSDIEVTENWIKPIIDLMEQDKNIAACQPKILSYFERQKFEYAGAAGGFIDRFGYPFCRGRLFQAIEEDHGQYNDVTEIFWASGACMFVRAEHYYKLGGLDNDFFAHMEEIDFCWRAKNEGLKIMYCPDSIVYHIGGGTLPKKSAHKTYLNIRNNIIMLFKNLPRKRLNTVLGLRFILDMIAALKFLIDGGFDDFWAVFKAYYAVYSNIRKYRRKRKLIHQGKVSEIYLGSVVLEYFVRRRKTFAQLKSHKFSL
jgi:GT2 family glycosyltransferase